MEEKNYTTIRNALDRLPMHQPPEMVWDGLALELDSDMPAISVLPILPQYTPSPDIWKNIEAGLEQDLEAQKARNGWEVFRGWKRLAAAAAVLLILVWTVFFRQSVFQHETIAVREEQVDDIIQKTLQEPENPVFNMVQTICLEHQPVCQQPEFQQLKTELDELTAAKTALKNAIGSYGNDPGLVVEIVKIERERSKILEQMVRMI